MIHLTKAAHWHTCLSGQHQWEHAGYSCDHPEMKLCPEHEPKEE